MIVGMGKAFALVVVPGHETFALELRRRYSGRHKQIALVGHLGQGTRVAFCQRRAVGFQTYLVSLDLKSHMFLTFVLLLIFEGEATPMSHVHGMVRPSQLISHHRQLLSSLVDSRQPGHLQTSLDRSLEADLNPRHPKWRAI